VCRNMEMTAYSFRDLLKTFKLDEEWSKTNVSLHLHNVAFRSESSDRIMRGRNEMMTENLISPPKLHQVSIDLCSLDVHAGQVMVPVLRAILHSNNKLRTLKISNSKMSVEFADMLK
jgi:hypothetical protein